jgi:hypothetical protein
MMQNLVFAVYFSMIRRNAICAVDVIASASSRIISLYAAIEVEELDVAFIVKICLVLAKVLICSRTTSIPRSSEALSSRTICRMFLEP